MMTAGSFFVSRLSLESQGSTVVKSYEKLALKDPYFRAPESLLVPLT